MSARKSMAIAGLLWGLASSSALVPVAFGKAPPRTRPALAAKAPVSKAPVSKVPVRKKAPAPKAPAATPAVDEAPAVPAAPAAPESAAASAPAGAAPAASTPPAPAAAPEPAKAEPSPRIETAKAEAAAPATPSAPGAPDLARLRADVQDVKEQVFRSRARRETLEKALLSTQLIASVEWVGSRRYLIKSAELRLDGARLWEAAEGQLGDKPVVLAAKSLAPGSHLLSVRVELRTRDNPKLGYVSEQTFALDAREGKKTKVEITIDEDGDPPSYNPDIEVDVEQD